MLIKDDNKIPCSIIVPTQDNIPRLRSGITYDAELKRPVLVYPSFCKSDGFGQPNVSIVSENNPANSEWQGTWVVGSTEADDSINRMNIIEFAQGNLYLSPVVSKLNSGRDKSYVLNNEESEEYENIRWQLNGGWQGYKRFDVGPHIQPWENNLPMNLYVDNWIYSYDTFYIDICLDILMKITYRSKSSTRIPEFTKVYQYLHKGGNGTNVKSFLGPGEEIEGEAYFEQESLTDKTTIINDVSEYRLIKIQTYSGIEREDGCSFYTTLSVPMLHIDGHYNIRQNVESIEILGRVSSFEFEPSES